MYLRILALCFMLLIPLTSLGQDCNNTKELLDDYRRFFKENKVNLLDKDIATNNSLLLILDKMKNKGSDEAEKWLSSMIEDMTLEIQKRKNKIVVSKKIEEKYRKMLEKTQKIKSK